MSPRVSVREGSQVAPAALQQEVLIPRRMGGSTLESHAVPITEKTDTM